MGYSPWGHKELDRTEQMFQFQEEHNFEKCFHCQIYTVTLKITIATNYYEDMRPSKKSL